MRAKYISALGYIVVMHPCLSNFRSEAYELVSFGLNGRWSSGSLHKTRADAAKARSKIFKHHRKLAKQRNAKKAELMEGEG